MKKQALSPTKLEATMNVLAAKICDLDVVIEYSSKTVSVDELNKLKTKRQKYIESFSRIAKKRWEFETEMVQATEMLKMSLPEYRGMPCADYKVPNSLVKYIKLDYNDE